MPLSSLTRTSRWVVLALVCWLAATGCIADAGEQAQDVASADQAELWSQLQAKYGVRPRSYEGYFNASNEAERRFHDGLGFAAKFVSSAGYQYYLDVTPAELAATFLCEGGVGLLDQNRSEGIDGFDSLGLDTMADSLHEADFAMLLPKSVLDIANNPDCIAPHTNELGQTVHSLSCLTIEDGLFASAAMYGWMKLLAADHARKRGERLDELPREAQFFWATVFFNAGPGTGSKLMDKYGVGYWAERWKLADDPTKYWTFAKYNAAWRTASYELLQKRVFDRPDPDADYSSEPGCVWSESPNDWGDGPSAAAALPPATDATPRRTLRGYLSRPEDQDWFRFDVQEASYATHMCIHASLDHAPAEYRLCVKHVSDGATTTHCARSTTGTAAVAFDVDRSFADDSGQVEMVVTPLAPPVVCESYQLSWSLDVASCACAGEDC